MSEGDTFSFRKEASGGGTSLILQGPIDERTNLKEVFSDLQGPALVIVLRDVTRINSSGVRAWINATKQLSDSFNLIYVECSRAIVDQLNMIANFFSSGSIKSFYAPYYCRGCDAERDMLVEIERHFKAGEEPEAPDFQCPKCGKALDFREDESKYFAFLSE